MRALVVYESMYGNTHAVASSIADGLRATHEVTLVPVAKATEELIEVADLLVAGGPTHMHGMTSAGSRRMAAESARKEGSGLIMDPDADGPGMRGWLSGLSSRHALAAAYDTRLTGSPAFTGRASRLPPDRQVGELPHQQAEHAGGRRGRAGSRLGSHARRRCPRRSVFGHGEDRIGCGRTPASRQAEGGEAVP